MSRLPHPADVELAARRLGLTGDAAELHGALAGWLAGGGADVAAWPGKVMADEGLPAPAPDDALDRLRKATVEQLQDRDFEFRLLLPDTDAPLQQRAAAVLEWCRGFLGGFGLAAGQAPTLSEEGREALQDLAGLARAAGDQFEGGEDEEAALAEIEEFVRVAALLLHNDGAVAARRRQRLN